MAVGEIFLADFIPVLFEKLASGELLNFARREQIPTLLMKWSRMLAEIEAVLPDAEEKQITERGIQMWLEDLEDFAYDLDDVPDKIATEALRRKLMEESRASTSKVAARASSTDSQRTQATSLIHESCIYGRDDDNKTIIELLPCDESKLHIEGLNVVENVGLEFYGLGCSNHFPSLEILRFKNGKIDLLLELTRKFKHLLTCQSSPLKVVPSFWVRDDEGWEHIEWCIGQHTGWTCSE
ncbi:keratin-associated protein, putative [Actinidia rufa]|uniref:Keratin-associated protein, putative n=1 Tax=Actinidia rufa TaxID=165716 RepID=A0A7J0FVG0_9ERIC|nr:keratin-associated protein, putative [Actinidia rufa]